MKIKPIIVTLFFSMITVNCHNDTPGGEPVSLPAGRATIAFHFFSEDTVEGFRFVVGKTIHSPDSAGHLADVILTVQPGAVDSLPDLLFADPLDLPTILPKHASIVAGITPHSKFKLMWQPTSTDSNGNASRVYFGNLTEIPDFSPPTVRLPVTKNQVWVFGTRDGKYGKMRIVTVFARTDLTNPDAPIYYGEITFDWVFQPNGSRKF